MSEEFESASEGADSTPDSAENSVPDPLDEELADLVDQVGPISKEAELLADLPPPIALNASYSLRCSLSDSTE